MTRAEDKFETFFRTATGKEPYDYQRRLATEVCADGPRSLAINVPTGALWSPLCLARAGKYA
jgi:reverse gyrase